MFQHHRAAGLLAAVLFISPSMAQSVVFSTWDDQFAQGPDTGFTLSHAGLYQAGDFVEGFAGGLVPKSMGLDAVDVLVDGGILFSVEHGGLVTTGSGTLYLHDDRPYLFDPAAGTITPVLDWNVTGLQLGTLDAIDRLDPGRYAFSIAEFCAVPQPGGMMTLRPENVYVMDASKPRIRLLFDGQARGLADLDALWIAADGRVAFSTETDVLVDDGDGMLHLEHQCAYLADEDSIEIALDGPSHGLYTLDAIDLSGAEFRVMMEKDRVAWTAPAGSPASVGSDVVRGDLQWPANAICVAHQQGTSWVDLDAVPAVGEGYWILVRRLPELTWESGGPGQGAPRAPALQGVCD